MQGLLAPEKTARTEVRDNPLTVLPSLFWLDFRLILVLGVLTLSLRLYLVWDTEATARDSIGYIRYAWQLGHRPWPDVMRQMEQPPLYALGVLVMSAPVRQIYHGPESVVMQLSAQLTSVLAGVFLVIPMFLLGKELFNRSVGFWAAMLFQCLPATGRFLSDGLSEATFLLFAAWALWLGVWSLRTRSALGFALTGLCGGLAYLTRAEGGLVVLSVALVLLGSQTIPVWRFPRRQFVACGTCLVVATMLIAGPYMAIIGGYTNKRSILNVIDNQVADQGPSFVSGPPLAVWWPGNIRDDKGWWGLLALGTELSRGMSYGGWLAAILGLWAFRDRLRSGAGPWILLLLCATMVAALWRLANVMGYLSDRHCLVILFCAMFWAAAGFQTAGNWLAARMRHFFSGQTAKGGKWRSLLAEGVADGRAMTWILFLAVIGVGLPKSLETLHANRAGLRQVGLWLHDHADPSDIVVDPYCWSHYYAGRVFSEGMSSNPPPGHQPVHYVVLENGKSEHSRLTDLKRAREEAEKGRIVYRWAGKQGKHDTEILVYEVPSGH